MYYSYNVVIYMWLYNVDLINIAFICMMTKYISAKYVDKTNILTNCTLFIKFVKVSLTSVLCFAVLLSIVYIYQ